MTKRAKAVTVALLASLISLLYCESKASILSRQREHLSCNSIALLRSFMISCDPKWERHREGFHGGLPLISGTRVDTTPPLCHLVGTCRLWSASDRKV
jgi:hypothetical protein